MITASIVFYNNPVEECYSIVNNLLDNSVDYIYLIDHSPNNRLNIWSDYSDHVIYLPHKNLGYGSGHNFALQRAAEVNPNGLHIVTNADITIQMGVIQKLEAFMLNNPTVGCCMPRILNNEGEEQRLYKYLPSPYDLFAKRFLPPFLSKKIVDRLTMCDCDRNKTLYVPWLSGCFMFLRMEAIKQTKGFDDRYFMYFEDLDLSRRISLLYDNVYYPDVSIVHKHKAASYHSARMCLIHICSAIKYFNKYGWFFDKERVEINNNARRKNKGGSFAT